MVERIRGRQPFTEHWLRNTGSQFGHVIIDQVVPVQVLEDDGLGDLFGAELEANQTNQTPARPYVVTLWAGARECIVWSVKVNFRRQIPQNAANNAAYMFTPPSGYRFLFLNGTQLAGPGLGTRFGTALDLVLRQSQAVIVAGNPWMPADDPPFPPQSGEGGTTGHPQVLTGVGNVTLRGPQVNQSDTFTIYKSFDEELVVRPLRLRRFDPLCVISLNPTLLTGGLSTMRVGFQWSELVQPAFEPTRPGFVGAL